MIPRKKLGPVPPETAMAARSCFKRRPNIYVQFADTFGELFDFSDFSEAYSQRGQSAAHPVRLLLLLMVAYLEGLSDRQVAEALTCRIDLKYLLALPLDHPGYDFSVLSEMRRRLLEGNLEALLLEKILQFAEERGLLSSSRQRTDSTTILAAARRLSRLELVIETLTHTLDVLSSVSPKLVSSVARGFEQLRAYEVSGFQFRLPKKETEQVKLAESVGRDGMRLLNAIDQSPQAEFLNEVDAVKTLRIVWTQQFSDPSDSDSLRYKKQDELAPSAEQIGSPYDLDARFTSKRNETKFGFSVHVTETCEPGAPRLITNILTTPATTSDSKSIEKIQMDLRAAGRQPVEHFVDAGYTKASLMLRALEQHGIEVVGPIRGGNSWQSQIDTGLDSSNFSIDWDTQSVTCPNGKTSVSWRPRKRGSVNVRFSASDCLQCPFQTECTKSANGRTLELQPQSLRAFITSQRNYQQTEEFQKRYASRAGVEGTVRQVKAPDAGRARYMGLEKTDLQFKLLAAGLNAVRILKHLCSIPLAATRKRAFARLMAAA